VPLAPNRLGPLLPQPLQARPTALLEARLDRAIPGGPLALDQGSPLPLRPLSLDPFAFEPLRDGLPAPKRDYLGLPGAKPRRWCRQTRCSLIGDAIAPCDSHAAGVSATSEAL
jgi:hypothetical protein